MRLERSLLAPEAVALSTELWGQFGDDFTTSQNPEIDICQSKLKQTAHNE
jgi:hypothetical protein